MKRSYLAIHHARSLLTLLLWLLTPLYALAATPGSLDTSFNIGTGFDNAVASTAVQADGKIVAGGWFTTVNGVTRNNIARLNTDGTLDTSFNPGTNNDVDTLAIQPDGKIIIGGYFTTVNGVARNRIARLNTDGTLDTGFDPGTGANNFVTAVALQPDGKVVLGGAFSTVNGVARRYIARLNADGSLDTGFVPDSGTNAAINALAIQPDGKVLIGGDFSWLNGGSWFKIARLNTDGSHDTSFNAGLGEGFSKSGFYLNDTVYALALQPDGKVIVGGYFTMVSGAQRSNIARLNSNGSLDMSFNSGDGDGNGIGGGAYNVLALALQADGKVIVGGDFLVLNGGEVYNNSGIARLHANGSLDTGFNPHFNTDWGSPIRTLSWRANGRLIVGGEFTIVNSQPANRLTSIHTGDVDADGIEDGADNDSDNDGTADAQDAFPFDPSEQLDTDSDSIGNNADLDDDGDGVPDYIDAEPLNASNANEVTLPLNGNYKGSAIRDNAVVE